MAGSISITDSDENGTDGATNNFAGASQSFGADATGRIILAGFWWREPSATDRSFSSASIDGTAATLLRQNHVGAAGCAIVGRQFDSGASGIVSVTLSGSVGRVLMAVARVTGCDWNSGTPFAVAGNTATGAQTGATQSVNTAANGVTFTFLGHTDTGSVGDLTYTAGVSQHSLQTVESFFYARAGYADTASAETPRAITSTFTSTSGFAWCSVSFSPSTSLAVGAGLTKSILLAKRRLIS